MKNLLTTAPVLAYSKFDQEYILETDASIHGLGGVLSQRQSDTQFHPVAYASRALLQAERNYAITELETLAVVWAVSHFRHLLYGNTVKIYTDHTSVKAVLESPNPSAKHARWWTRVFGCGVKDIQICYRAGRENQRADALSRSPCSLSQVRGIAEGKVQVASVTGQDPHQLSVQTIMKNELTNDVTSLETCDTAIAPMLDEHREDTWMPASESHSQAKVNG